MKRHIACFCETTFEADIPEAADAKQDPGIEEQILDGSFMELHCPACGKRLTPEFPFHLTGLAGAGDIFMIPETDRASYVAGSLAYPVGTPARVAMGFAELAEKVLISRAGLDDRVIEIMKYYLLTGPASKGEETPSDVTISWHGKEGGKHVFHVAGLREGEVAVARLADDLYAKIAADVEQRVTQEPFRDFCEPPWVSLRRVAGEKT